MAFMLMKCGQAFGKIPTWMVFVLVALLSFGLFIPWLGFFWDDWPILYYIDNQNLSGLITYYSFDRPLVGYLAMAAGALVGNSAFLWQFLVLGLRLFTSYVIWGVLKNLWPQEKFLTGAAALVFLVYPGYDTQPMNSTYAHWTTYLLFFISLYATGRAMRDTEHSRRWTFMGLLAQAGNIFSLEFFVVLELIRPVYIGMLLNDRKGSIGAQLLRMVLKQWVPYLILLVGWFFWRFFILTLPEQPHALQLLVDLRANPVPSLISYATVALLDVVYLCTAVWFETAGRLLVLGSLYWWWFVALAIALPALLWMRLSSNSNGARRTAGYGVIFGGLAVIFGLAPVWVIGDAANSGGYGSHYLLGGLFGASVFIASLLSLIPRKEVRLALFFVIVVLAVGRQLMVSNEFAMVWREQRTFYWQLYWRAPTIKPNTALIFFYPISDYMQQSSTSMAINTLYPQTLDVSRLNYWTYDIRLTQVQRSLERHEPLQMDYRLLEFTAEDPGSQVFLYKLADSCLWLLTPAHIQNDYIPSENRGLLERANPKRIIPTVSFSPSQATFGKEIPHDWCFYFEKADLSAQEEDWMGVLDLMQEAETEGLHANYALEYIPVLKAYAHLDRWEEFSNFALDLTDGYKQSRALMCTLWQELEDVTVDSPAKDVALNLVRQGFICEP